MMSYMIPFQSQETAPVLLLSNKEPVNLMKNVSLSLSIYIYRHIAIYIYSYKSRKIESGGEIQNAENC